MKYELNETEVATMNKWLKEHDCSDKRYMKSVTFTPTGIGYNIKVKCTCGEEKDVTDYGCW